MYTYIYQDMGAFVLLQNFCLLMLTVPRTNWYYHSSTESHSSVCVQSGLCGTALNKNQMSFCFFTAFFALGFGTISAGRLPGSQSPDSS